MDAESNQNLSNLPVDVPIQSTNRIKTDIFIKQILRAFRSFLKNQFQTKFGRKYYYWIPKTLRKNTEVFFQEIYPAIDPQDYIEYENIFMLLIHNTKAKEISKMVKVKSAKVTKLFKDTFGQKPNQKNLKSFFKLEIIQKLWWSPNGFFHSKDLKDIVTSLNSQELQKLVKSL